MQVTGSTHSAFTMNMGTNSDSIADHPPPLTCLVPYLVGVAKLWEDTLGDPAVTIAMLDGAIDLSHACFRGASVTEIETSAGYASRAGSAEEHGTQVASVIFGQHAGLLKGIAPRCRGLSVPIFAARADGSPGCSELDLARGILSAIQHGAHIVNISGGELSLAGKAHPLLAGAVAECCRRNILIVAAAGNDGCRCLHVPAALECVLAVGAMDSEGRPLEFSNWGGHYRQQGILAHGSEILAARAGGGTIRCQGTSFAAAIVSGLAGLLLSLQRKHGRKLDPLLVRSALIRSADGCQEQSDECRRLLAGRINVQGALSLLIKGTSTMSDSTTISSPDVAALSTEGSSEPPVTAVPPATTVRASSVQASACGCKGGAGQLVYALGQIGYDLISEARLDSLAQKIAGGQRAGTAPDRTLPFNPSKLHAYLEKNPWDSAAVEWTLSVDDTPIYAIRPQGPYAADAYKELRAFLKQRYEEGVERVSIPGVMSGSATLLLGQTVPVIVPELRGMYSWTTKALVDAVAGPEPARRAPARARETHKLKSAGVYNFLMRVYHELRNLGVLPQDRAINFSATNAFEIEKIYEQAIQEKMELDTINVSRSPICRPGSDCWDVEVFFFFPEHPQQTVRKVYRFTVDVSDTVPVTVGSMRSWFTR